MLAPGSRTDVGDSNRSARTGLTQVVAVKENTYYHDEKANRIYQHSAAGKPGFGPAIKGTLPDVAMAYLCKKS